MSFPGLALLEWARWGRSRAKVYCGAYCAKVCRGWHSTPHLPSSTIAEKVRKEFGRGLQLKKIEQTWAENISIERVQFLGNAKDNTSLKETGLLIYVSCRPGRVEAFN